MGKYIVKSLLQVIPVLLIVSLIVFILVRVTGDPVALMLPETATEEDRAVLAQALGLDQPLYTQYVKFLGSALKGDFGRLVPLWRAGAAARAGTAAGQL